MQRSRVGLRVRRGGSVCEDEVLLEEEEGGGVILVDGDPLALVPVQVVVLHQHLQATRTEMSVKNVRFMKKTFLGWGSDPRKSWKYSELAWQYKIRAQNLNFQGDQIESTIGF